MNLFKNSLAGKLFLVAVVSLFTLLIIQSVITHIYINQKVDDWHFQELETNESIALRLMGKEFSNLGLLTQDYARWNDMYQYIDAKASSSHKRPLLSEEYLSKLNLVGAGYYDLEFNELELTSLYSTGVSNELSKVLASKFSKGKNSGLILLDGRLLMYMQRSVTSTGNIKPNGYIVFLREFNDKLVKEIGTNLGVFIAVSINDDAINNVKYQIQEMPSTILESYFSAPDNIIGKYRYRTNKDETLPLQLTIQVDKKLHQFFNFDLLYLFKTLGNIIVSLIIALFIRKKIVKPIVSMSNQLSNLEIVNEHYSPLSTEHDNEVGKLAKSINRLFEKVYHQHKFNQKLLDSNQDVVLTINNSMEITYANPSAIKKLRVKEDKLMGLNIDFVLASKSNGQHTLLYYLMSVIKSGEGFSKKLSLRNSFNSEKTVTVEVNGYPLSHEMNEEPGVLIIIRRCD